MRIISGKARGKKLKAPPGRDTRPITDMIKEALFNIIGNDIKGAIFLDLFAGSGSVGIEALSRDAAWVVFVDSSRIAVKTIYENIYGCRFDNNYEVHCNDAFRALDILARRGVSFDYIYVDPPFTNEGIFNRILKHLDTINILLPGGIIIIRTQRKKALTNLTRLYEYRTDSYGESTLHYYRYYSENEEDVVHDGSF